MGQSGRFTFVPRNIDGDMVGASANQPTGTDGYLYYEMILGMTPGSGQGDGKRVGFIAYDYINTRWSCLFTSGTGITLHESTTYFDDIGQIKAFMAGLATPVTTAQNGDDLPYPKSMPAVNS